MSKLILATTRDGYGLDQVKGTMTAAELIDFLSDFDGDTEIYLDFDNGYTYGAIKEQNFREAEEE